MRAAVCVCVCVCVRVCVVREKQRVGEKEIESKRMGEQRPIEL